MIFTLLVSSRLSSYLSFTILLITAVLPERLPITVLIAHNWILQTSRNAERKMIRFSPGGFIRKGRSRIPCWRIRKHLHRTTMVHEHVSRHVNCDSDRTRLNRCCPLRLVIYLAVWLIRPRNEEEPRTSFQINLNCRGVSKVLGNYKYLSCFKNPVHSEDYISKKKEKKGKKKRGGSGGWGCRRYRKAWRISRQRRCSDSFDSTINYVDFSKSYLHNQGTKESTDYVCNVFYFCMF